MELTLVLRRDVLGVDQRHYFGVSSEVVEERNTVVTHSESFQEAMLL